MMVGELGSMLQQKNPYRSTNSFYWSCSCKKTTQSKDQILLGLGLVTGRDSFSRALRSFPRVNSHVLAWGLDENRGWSAGEGKLNHHTKQKMCFSAGEPRQLNKTFSGTKQGLKPITWILRVDCGIGRHRGIARFIFHSLQSVEVFGALYLGLWCSLPLLLPTATACFLLAVILLLSVSNDQNAGPNVPRASLSSLPVADGGGWGRPVQPFGTRAARCKSDVGCKQNAPNVCASCLYRVVGHPTVRQFCSVQFVQVQSQHQRNARLHCPTNLSNNLPSEKSRDQNQCQNPPQT